MRCLLDTVQSGYAKTMRNGPVAQDKLQDTHQKLIDIHTNRFQS